MAELVASEPLILPTADSGYRNGIDLVLDQLEGPVTIAAEVDDMAMMRLLTREDIGLAILPAIVVTDELANGKLIEACQVPGVSEVFSAITLSSKFSHDILETLFDG